MNSIPIPNGYDFNVGELVKILGGLDPSWRVRIGFEGTHGVFISINLYPDGVLSPPVNEEYRKQRYRDRGEEVPDPFPAEERRYLVDPQTVILDTD